MPTTGTYLNYPYDQELFLMQWRSHPDLMLTAMFDSGAVQANATIRSLIANGSDFFTIPFYNVLTGEAQNYDGATNILMTEPSGSYQNGIVYGRAHAWKDRDFIRDFNSGADQMKQITSQVAKFWQKYRQSLMLKILNGLFGVTTGTETAWVTDWAKHTYDISASGSTVADTNKIGLTTAAEAMQKATGDNMNVFSMAFMHSRTAMNLAGKELLEYRKYTDMNGVQRTLNIADWNGLTVIVDDSAPYDAASDKYTTYLMGVGALQYAPAPVDTPVEIGRDKLEDGGYNYYVTRFRECLHPNGFSFVVPSTGYTKSPTDTQLGDSANWKISADPKAITIARIISNG